jgi:Divergent InlB B-repeat domain
MTSAYRLRLKPWWSGLTVLVMALAGCGGSGNSAAPDPVTFAVTVSVSGSGKVTSPSAIDCGTVCSTNVPTNTSITLTAAPAPGQVLQSWGGACASASGDSCAVTVTEATSVSAAFVAQPSNVALTVAVTGSGSVSSQPAGIDCGSTCSASFAPSTSVVLTAAPAQGQVLQGWGGACASATGNTCSVTLAQATSASATFVAQTSSFALAVAVTGTGSVSSQPAGINCGSTCSANFAAPTAVVLTAAPGQGQVLQAWGGACSGATATCSVTMSAARNVTATFTAATGPALAWGTAALLESSNDFNVAGTNAFADTNVLTAIDANGNALVIWQQSDGNTEKVFSRRYVAGQGWAPAVTVPGLVTASASVNLVTGRIVMDAAGMATWIRHNFETRRYGATGGWAATAFSPATLVGEIVDAKLDAGGSLHALAYGGGEVHYSRLPAGSAQWSAWADVSLSSQNASRQAALALGQGSEAIAVWRERNTGDNNYSMKANRTVSGAWQTPLRIEELTTNVNDASPRIASDAAGNALAAWHQANSVYISRFDAAAGTWSTPTEIDAGQAGTTFPARIQLAMAADGRAVLAWNATNALKAASFAQGTGLSTPVVVNSYNAGHFVGIDTNGRAVVVYRSFNQWPNPTDVTVNLYGRELPWGGTWSAAALLESGAGDVKSNVPCAMNAAGQAACTWAQNDLANDTVRNSLWATVRR